jgi:hypothetical protein
MWSPDGLALPSRSLAKAGQRRFFAKARPDPLFKYFSNASALGISVNATAVLIRQGRNFEVWGTDPLLCFSSRFAKFSV